MIKKSMIRILYYFIFFMLTMNLSFTIKSYSAELEIEEIITAIKQEIQTANITESGSPSFKIDTVEVVLSVVSTDTEKGGLSLKVAGFSDEIHNDVLNPKSFHTLAFSFKPAGVSGFFSEASLGLVEPIKKIKSSLRKAYNSPPSFYIDALTFKLEFAIGKSPDGAISFKIINLEDMKAKRIATHQITLYMKIKE